MLLKQITIQSDFFQMLKILTPTCRHEILDALLVYAFGNGEAPMRPAAKAIFDIIRRDIESQIYPDGMGTDDTFLNCIEPTMQVTLPGEVCQAEMPFPYLWEKMPYETAAVVRPDYIPCMGDKGTCPYKTTLDSVPQLAEMVVTMNNSACSKKQKDAPYMRLEVPVLRTVPAANGYPDDTEIVVQTIVMEKGKWRDVMERFIKTSGNQIGASHPMSRLPFMRCIGPEAMSSAKRRKNLKKRSKTSSESLADRMTRWTRQLNWNKDISVDAKENLLGDSETKSSNNSRNKFNEEINECNCLSKENNGVDKNPPYMFWPVIETEKTDTKPCSLQSKDSAFDKQMGNQEIIIAVEPTCNPFPMQGNYARGVPHATH